MRTLWSYLAVIVLTATVTYALAHLKPVSPSAPEPAGGNRQQPAPAPVNPPESRMDQAAPVSPPPLPAEADVSPEEQTNIRIYQQVNRSVVNITSRSISEDEFFLLSGPREGSGSGSVLDKQGHILTNYHVVEGAQQITVTLFDGSSLEARLVGSDPNNDVAVIQIDAPAAKLFPIVWGDSTKLLVGMRVFAIGNPFGLERTLTTGIISSLNRTLRAENKRLIRGIIQTDAAINPGNSGGPLLNGRGEMIGITTAIVSRAGQSSGIGLAVPASIASRVKEELIRFGRVIRPDCGIFSVSERDDGLLIARLIPDGPAERAGLRGPQERLIRRGNLVYRALDRSKADRIVAVAGRPVKSLDDLLSYIESKKPGDQVTFRIVREGRALDVPVTLAEAGQ
jgi:S1-C subfamily serine protease